MSPDAAGSEVARSSGAPSAPRDPEAGMPPELSTSRIGRRILEMGVVLALIGVVVLSGPGVGALRNRRSHASALWLVAGVVLEVFSAWIHRIMTVVPSGAEA